MNNKNHCSESGQVIILLAFAFVALLGFTALAIDGGMVFSDRRHAQNAVDASSLAGAATAAQVLATNSSNDLFNYSQWDCSSALAAITGGAETAAINRADSNNYSIDIDSSDLNGVDVSCGNLDLVGFYDRYIDVTTHISATTQTSFAQLIYGSPLRYTAKAVARVRPSSPLGLGNAIVALREDCPNNNTGGVHFTGDIEVTVNGGGVFSNACLDAGGSVEVEVNDGGITCVGAGCYEVHGNPGISPDVGEVHLFDFAMNVPVPNCNEVTDRGSHNGSGTIDPGRYDRIKLTNGALNLNPGLYCVTKFDFEVLGGTVVGDGVTIYLTKGGFKVAGNPTINLSAPSSDPDPAPAIPGVLIYLAEGNTSDVALVGNSSSSYEGTVFAPSGVIVASGDTSVPTDTPVTFNTQLVGNTVIVSGNAQIEINFEDDLVFFNDPVLELFE